MDTKVIRRRPDEYEGVEWDGTRLHASNISGWVTDRGGATEYVDEDEASDLRPFSERNGFQPMVAFIMVRLPDTRGGMGLPTRMHKGDWIVENRAGDLEVLYSHNVATYYEAVE